jgi:hypothetical protein
MWLPLLLCVLSVRAGADPRDADWILQPHPWVAARYGSGSFSGGLSSLVSDRTFPPLGAHSVIGLGFARKDFAELAVGRACEHGYELQLLLDTAPLDFGGDSILAPGDVPLAKGTIYALMAGASGGMRKRFMPWGQLGDGALAAGLLLGVAWPRGLEPTPTARRLGLEVRGSPALVGGVDARMDQRLHGGLMASLGLRFCSAFRLVRVTPGPGSIYHGATTNWNPVLVSLGLAYWF